MGMGDAWRLRKMERETQMVASGRKKVVKVIQKLTHVTPEARKWGNFWQGLREKVWQLFVKMPTKLLIIR